MRTRASTWSAALLVLPAALVGLGGLTQPTYAGDFFPSPGSYVVDTTTLTMTGPGGTVMGEEVGGVAVFAFDTVSIPSDVTLQVVGSRPFRLQASGALSVGGAIRGDGSSSSDFSTAAMPGGPGGGAGGAAGSPGAGPGGGGVAGTINDGAGGGGFGGVGARGGPVNGSGVGGPAYGPLHVSLQGGSGGGGAPAGGSTRGGGGGGLLELVGSSVLVAPGALVSADGGGGAVGAGGASGGGSGGAVVVRGTDVEIGGVVRARGGPGGAGGCCGDGGGGGGGRVAYLYSDTLALTGSTNVSGGISGFRSTSGIGPGAASANPTGGQGVVTTVHASGLAADGAATVPYGTATTLAATLTDLVTGQPLPGRQVALVSRPTAGGEWALVGTFPTSDTGRASTPVQPTANTDYEWRYAGDESHQAAAAARTVLVSQRVTLRSTASRPAAGTAYRLWGKVTPAVVGEAVTLQRKSAAGWRTLVSTTLKEQSLPGGSAVGYSFKRTASKGTWRFRVVKAATDTLARGTSPVSTVTVR